MSAKPNVFVVEDDLSMREALTSLIGLVGLTVQTFTSAREFLGYARPKTPACLVLDVRMPGMSGLALQQELAKAGDRIPIVFITGHGDVPMAVQAMKTGAVEFLQKPFRDEDLLAAITRALERGQRDFDEAGSLRAVQARFEMLTAREREVLPLIVRGTPNKLAAQELGITEPTIKVHRHNIMQKMQARSLPDLVRIVQALQRSGR